MLLLERSLGEVILKLCNNGVPVLLGCSDCHVSIGLIMLESMSVGPYDTSVESCVGKESDDLRRALKSSLLSGLSRRTVYGFSFPGLVSSISGDFGMFVRSVTSLWCDLSWLLLLLLLFDDAIFADYNLCS